MALAVKIFTILGLTDRTINDKVDIQPDSTLSWLIDYLNSKYGFDILQSKYGMAMLDGEAIDIKQSLERRLEGIKEFWILPHISGG